MGSAYQSNQRCLVRPSHSRSRFSSDYTPPRVMRGKIRKRGIVDHWPLYNCPRSLQSGADLSHECKETPIEASSVWSSCRGQKLQHRPQGPALDCQTLLRQHVPLAKAHAHRLLWLRSPRLQDSFELTTYRLRRLFWQWGNWRQGTLEGGMQSCICSLVWCFYSPFSPSLRRRLLTLLSRYLSRKSNFCPNARAPQ